MRITIAGLPGSGKSTLAREISQKLQIPHIHLDQFWFAAGGKQAKEATPNLEAVRAQVRGKVLEAIQAESWVSDGSYLRVQAEIAERADAIVYLDMSVWQRLWNHSERMMKPRHRLEDISFLDDLTFFWQIIRRTVTSKPKLEAFLQNYRDKTIVLTSRNEMTRYTERLIS